MGVLLFFLQMFSVKSAREWKKLGPFQVLIICQVDNLNMHFVRPSMNTKYCNKNMLFLCVKSSFFVFCFCLFNFFKITYCSLV